MKRTDLIPVPALPTSLVSTLPEENEIPAFKQLTDAEIAAKAADALFWITTACNLVKITVRDGWVSLDGVVNWEHQKKVIEEVIQNVPGIRRVNNYIKVNESLETHEILAGK
jgi:osmotically-inducible protein OsmY